MKTVKINDRCKYSHFENGKGGAEFFFVFEAEESRAFSDALSQMSEDVSNVLAQLGLGEKTTTFCRFYLSDVANQRDKLTGSELFRKTTSGAYSVIEQSPLGVGKLTLLLYHITGASFSHQQFDKAGCGWKNDLKVTGKNYTQYWSGNYISDEKFDSYVQTDGIFNHYVDFLDAKGMTLFDHCVRTWIYVRDIDNHYAGMVESRKEFFDKHGLTADTHYIASTGIEARLNNVGTLVSMDALAIDGIVPEQVTQMEALDHLNPTHEYGVTFERGTKITYGDREHFYISGTASIDKCGEVVHVGDIEKQTYRTLENINALLNPHGADLSDMAYLIVYLRNITDEKKVIELLNKEVGEAIPKVIVNGAVCRPTWLIEIEGVGVKAAETDFPIFA